MTATGAPALHPGAVTVEGLGSQSTEPMAHTLLMAQAAVEEAQGLGLMHRDVELTAMPAELAAVAVQEDAAVKEVSPEQVADLHSPSS